MKTLSPTTSYFSLLIMSKRSAESVEISHFLQLANVGYFINKYNVNYFLHSYNTPYLDKVNYFKIFLDLICKHFVYDSASILSLIFNFIFVYCLYLVLVSSLYQTRLDSFVSFNLFSETLWDKHYRFLESLAKFIEQFQLGSFGPRW